MNDLTNFVFDADDGTPRAVRSVMVDGEPWFVAKDVLAVLKLDRKALERLDDEEKGVYSIHTLGGDQDMTVVSESGLYSLILGSRKPEAKRFKKWVTGEVLPSIRKTGAYVGPDAQISAASAAPTLFLSHGADILVAADRSFRSLIRSGRAAGMPTGAAIRRANQLTLERTGIDLLTELDAHDAVVDVPGFGAVDHLPDFWAALTGEAYGCVGRAPMLSTQVGRLYLHWCRANGVVALGFAQLVETLQRARLVRPARKRWVGAQNSKPLGPHRFLFPVPCEGPPSGMPEPAWLGVAVQAVDVLLEEMRI